MTENQLPKRISPPVAISQSRLSSSPSTNSLSQFLARVIGSVLVLVSFLREVKSEITKNLGAEAEFSTAQRARLDVLLEEYRQLSTEIKLRVDFQQKLTNYQLIAAGVIATIGVRITQLDSSQIINSELVRYYFLITPVVFLVFSWTFSNNDIMIMSVARYINKHLARNIRNLVNSDDVLNFEIYLQKDRQTLIKRYGLFALVGQEFALQFVLPIIFLAIFFYLFHSDISSLKSNQKTGVRSFQLSLLLSNAILYALTLRLRFKIWKDYRRLLT